MSFVKFTGIEREVIFLNASIESIDSIVNRQFIEVSKSECGGQAIFKTSIHYKLFIIILLDFLSKCAEEITGEAISCLDALEHVCERPYLNPNESVRSLKKAVATFKTWLYDETVREKVWFPSIEFSAELKVQRHEFIEICGDISKHNFARLSKRANDVKRILLRSGKVLMPDEVFLVMDEFYDKFHDDVLAYHASHIVELLNNIRWGIREYLMPVHKVMVVTQDSFDKPKCEYFYPYGINGDFIKQCFRELMSDVKKAPYLEQFGTYHILKLHH